MYDSEKRGIKGISVINSTSTFKFNYFFLSQAGKKNAMEVATKEKTFYMYADTEKEKDEWIGAIGK